MINRAFLLVSTPLNEKFSIVLKNKSLVFWKCFITHLTDKRNDSSIFIDETLEVEEKSILDVILFRSKEKLKEIKLIFNEWDIDEDDLKETGSDLGLSNLFGAIKQDDFDNSISLADMIGEKFVFHHVSLLDYYVFFRRLKLYGEMEYIKKQLHKVNRIEVLLFLFLKCVRMYENDEVKEMFLKKKLRLKKNKKKKSKRSLNSKDNNNSESMFMKELDIEIFKLHHEQLRSSKTIIFNTSFASTCFTLLKQKQSLLRSPDFLEHVFHFFDLLGYSKSKSLDESITKNSKSILERMYLNLKTVDDGMKNYNIILLSKQKTKFYAHKEVLALRSQFFNDILRKKKKTEERDLAIKEDSGEEILEVNELHDEDIRQLLRFFYTSIIDLKEEAGDNDFESFIRLFAFSEKNYEKEFQKLLCKYIKALIYKIPKPALRENFLRFGRVLDSDRLRTAFCAKCCVSVLDSFYDPNRLGRSKTMRYIEMSSEMDVIERRIKKLMKATKTLEENQEKLNSENTCLKKRIEEVKKKKNAVKNKSIL